MSKRKRPTVSKRAHGPKMAARAQRTKSDIVRSTKANPLCSSAGPFEAPPNPRHDSVQAVPLVEDRAAALHDEFSQTTKQNVSVEGFDEALATWNVHAYQAKLLEIVQANMQFVLEFALRLAAVGRHLKFPPSLENSQAGELTCSGSIRKKWRN